MSELQPHIEERADEVEAAIKAYLGQPNKQYTTTFQVRWLELPEHLKAYPKAIKHLQDIGKIEIAGSHPGTTKWRYLGPEGADTLESDQV